MSHMIVVGGQPSCWLLSTSETDSSLHYKSEIYLVSVPGSMKW